MDYRTELERALEESLEEAAERLHGWDEIYLASLRQYGLDIVHQAEVALSGARPNERRSLLDYYKDKIRTEILMQAGMISSGPSWDPEAVVDRVLEDFPAFESLPEESKWSIKDSLVQTARNLKVISSAVLTPTDLGFDLEGYISSEKGDSLLTPQDARWAETAIRQAAAELILRAQPRSDAERLAERKRLEYLQRVSGLPDRAQEEFWAYFNNFVDNILDDTSLTETEKVGKLIEAFAPGRDFDQLIRDLESKYGGGMVITSEEDLDRVANCLLEQWTKENLPEIWDLWAKYRSPDRSGNPVLSALMGLFWAKQSTGIAAHLLRWKNMLPALSRLGRMGLLLKQAGKEGIGSLLTSAGTAMALLWNGGWAALMGLQAFHDIFSSAALWDHLMESRFDATAKGMIRKWLRERARNNQLPSWSTLVSDARQTLFPAITASLQREIEKVAHLPEGFLALEEAGAPELAEEEDGVLVTQSIVDRFASGAWEHLMERRPAIVAMLEEHLDLPEDQAQRLADTVIHRAWKGFAEDLAGKALGRKIDPRSLSDYVERQKKFGWLSDSFLLSLGRNELMRETGSWPWVLGASGPEGLPPSPKAREVMLEAFERKLAKLYPFYSAVGSGVTAFDYAVSSRIGWDTLLQDFSDWLNERGLIPSSRTESIELAERYISEKLPDLVEEVVSELH